MRHLNFLAEDEWELGLRCNFLVKISLIKTTGDVKNMRPNRLIYFGGTLSIQCLSMAVSLKTLRLSYFEIHLN